MTSLSFAVRLTQDLVKCPSVTPAEGGALDLLEQVLTELGFSCTRLPFGEGEARIDNLFARIGSGHPHIAFAGHTDVVPTGDLAAWSCDPFAGEVRDDQIYGRGTADMKGGIAAFVAAVKTYLESNKLQGSISLIITGDEEGDARYGTVKMVEWLEETGQQPDFCIVGEPTNPNELGEMIKNGRRGSRSCRLRGEGVQGHVAYPHLANNPVPALFAILAPVNSARLDGGTDYFDPSTAEVTDIELVGGASNVIPQAASAAFNIRFNTEHSVASLQGWLEEHFDRVASQHTVTYQADFASNASPFITEPGVLTTRMQAAISRLTNKQASLSTTGGTSDARFICKICPVAEFGLVGQTMHKIDEHVAIADIDQLAAIYAEMLAELDTE